MIYLFFTKIINISKGIPHYGLYLLTGIVLWNYWVEATGNWSPASSRASQCFARCASRGW